MSAAHYGSDRRIQRRLALVIGVWDYNHNQDLRNPGHDADDMASTLTSSGFQVTKGLNLTSARMHSMITDFVREIRPSDLVLFYFSGHGTQWHDQNFLIPSDDQYLTDTNIREHAINAQEVLNQITRRNPYVSLFFLDCCRNYYLSGRDPHRGQSRGEHGLTSMHATAGSLIAFACAPGSTARDGTGRNGLYTKHLLVNIQKPGEQIQDLLIDVTKGVTAESHGDQRPWYNNCLEDKNIMIANGHGSHQSHETPVYSDRKPSNLIQKLEKRIGIDLDGDGRIG